MKKYKPKSQLGQLVRTADIKKVLSKGDSTNWSSNYAPELKSNMTQLLHIQSTIYLKDIMKTY